MAIIIDEVINNYVNYEDLSTLKIEVGFKKEKEKLFIEFINNGIEFDQLKVEEESYSEYSEDITVGGFGIMIVKEMTSDIKYVRENNLNKLSMSIDLL